MRKKRIIKNHLVKPDTKFNSVLVSQLINKVMKNGEKRKATNIVYQSAEAVEKKISSPFLTVLKVALENVRPLIEMKSRKIGASKRRIPKEIDEIRSNKIALRWIVEGAREGKVTNLMHINLAEEISNAHNSSGGAFERKKTLYKEAESSGYSFPNDLKESSSHEKKSSLKSQ